MKLAVFAKPEDLRMRRKRLGWTVGQFASRAGLQPETIRRLEQGKRRVQYESGRKAYRAIISEELYCIGVADAIRAQQQKDAVKPTDVQLVTLTPEPAHA